MADAIRIAGIVLAAGKGSRMGGPKALIRIGGTTLLEGALEGMAAARLEDVAVVLDPRAEIFGEASRIAAATGARVVENPAPEHGMLSSVRCALDALGEPAAGRPASESDRVTAATHVALLPVDHPPIRAETFARLAAQAANRPEAIVVPRFGGRRGHPALFPRSLFPALVSAPNEIGARAVLRAHPDRVLEIDVDDPAVVRDLNTPDDLLRA